MHMSRKIAAKERKRLSAEYTVVRNSKESTRVDIHEADLKLKYLPDIIGGLKTAREAIAELKEEHDVALYHVPILFSPDYNRAEACNRVIKILSVEI